MLQLCIIAVKSDVKLTVVKIRQFFTFLCHFNFFNSCQMFQQTALCHTTSQSKRREKGEQEKWKTCLQSKLFIEIVEIRPCMHYDKIWSLVFTKNIKHFVVTNFFFVFATLFTLEAYGRFHVTKNNWSHYYMK